jgi:hypothetical protein
MPNHVTNRVVLVGTESDIKELVETLKTSEEELFDFNKIIPMPVELKGTMSPCKIVSQEEYEKEIINIEFRRNADPKSWDLNHPITQEMHDDFIKRFGYADWYGWTCNNWGTKWGSYSCCITEITPTGMGTATVTYTFDTAWATPIPIFERLSNMFPNVIIKLTWADEDVSYNTGTAEWFAGAEIDSHQPEGGSLEAYDLYFELHEGTKDDYELIDGKYVYKDDEE